MKKLGEIYFSILVITTVAMADDATWHMIGRTNQVEVRWSNFHSEDCNCSYSGGSSPCTPTAPHGCFKGTTTLSLNIVDSAISPTAQEMAGFCVAGSPYFTEADCEDLSLVLGVCSRTKTQSTVTNFGERITVHHYSCSPMTSARCLEIEGHLTPGIRIEAVDTASGCQF